MNKQFPILAIETTSDLCSVAVQFNENDFIELNYLAKHIHSEKLMSMIAQVVEESKIDISNFSCVAVSIGPGSFTGLRIGLSSAKGIAFGASLPIIPVPTFDALALQVKNFLPPSIEFSILFSASIEDYYFSKYKIDDDHLIKIDEISLIPYSKISEKLKKDDLIFGNAEFDELNVKKIYTQARSISNWAYLFGKDLLTFNYDNLEPLYVKQFIGKVKP